MSVDFGGMITLPTWVGEGQCVYLMAMVDTKNLKSSLQPTVKYFLSVHKFFGP